MFKLVLKRLQALLKALWQFQTSGCTCVLLCTQSPGKLKLKVLFLRSMNQMFLCNKLKLQLYNVQVVYCVWAVKVA